MATSIKAKLKNLNNDQNLETIELLLSYTSLESEIA